MIQLDGKRLIGRKSDCRLYGSGIVGNQAHDSHTVE